MVLEAGLEVDLSQLALVGKRGIVVAVAGSLCPLLLGFAVAKAFGLATKSALAVGASLAPTSMGISLKVLQDGKVLRTPTGQLIIAAAVIDDDTRRKISCARRKGTQIQTNDLAVARHY